MELAMCNKVVLVAGSMLIKVVRRTTEKDIRHSIVMKKPLELEDSTMTIESVRFVKGQEVEGLVGKSPIFKYKLATMVELGSLIPITDETEPNSLWKASKKLTASNANIVLVGQTISEVSTDYVDYYIGDISNIFGAK